MRLFFLLLLSFGITSCDNEGPNLNPVDIKRVPSTSYPGVNAEFWPFFERFEEEAKKRGQDISLSDSGITGAYRLTIGPVVGECNHDNDLPGTINIDSVYWNKADEFRQELILFHELGHCSLQRNHDNSINPNDVPNCNSIMNDGKGLECFPKVYDQDTRAAYLDELFSK